MTTASKEKLTADQLRGKQISEIAALVVSGDVDEKVAMSFVSNRSASKLTKALEKERTAPAA